MISCHFAMRERLIIDVEDGADAIFSDGFVQFFWVDVDVLVIAVNNRLDGQLRHLADFFFQRHLREKFVNGGR